MPLLIPFFVFFFLALYFSLTEKIFFIAKSPQSCATHMLSPTQLQEKKHMKTYDQIQ
jgi:hypothetical protein